MTRLLLIDDDATLCTLLTELLEDEGFSVDTESHGVRGLDRALHGEFELIVLDMMLPGLDGFTVLQELRKASQVPVLMLTARGKDSDRIGGLELGADDYVIKPFNPRELLARIRAILRRAQAAPVKGRPAIEVNGVTVDPNTRQVYCDGLRVLMTTLEFDNLLILIRSAGRPVSRDELMESIYNRRATPFERSIDLHVSHLRRKLETDRELIKTVRGAGYQFCLAEPERHR